MRQTTGDESNETPDSREDQNANNEDLGKLVFRFSFFESVSSASEIFHTKIQPIDAIGLWPRHEKNLSACSLIDSGAPRFSGVISLSIRLLPRLL